LRENQCADNALVGTHVLTEGRSDDVVGNAAALDVFKFLKLSHDGKTVLTRALANDPALLAALSDNAEQAQLWIEAFAGIVTSKVPAASHTLAKQLYFPLPEGGYHLLAPLFPTALVHRLHDTLQTDRFSDAAKDARAARKENNLWHEGYREYPDLAVQNFGGSKPQNISQLNSERGGVNHLLPSLPPMWQSERVTPPMRRKSIFAKYGAIGSNREIWERTKTLRKFLLDARDWNNIKIRNRRADLVAEIIDLVLDFAARTQEDLPGGWSMRPECQLDAVEKYWLDPGVAEEVGTNDQPTGSSLSQTDWADEIASRFGNWLNAAISTERTPMGDEEHREWKLLLKEELNGFREEIAR
jgi:CRISPR-associated protein Csy1